MDLELVPLVPLLPLQPLHKKEKRKVPQSGCLPATVRLAPEGPLVCLHFHDAHSNFGSLLTVNSHENLAKMATALTSLTGAQAALQLIYDGMGFAQGRQGEGGWGSGLHWKKFESFDKKTGTKYDETKRTKQSFEGDEYGKKVKKVETVDEEGNKVEKEENTADPLEDDDKNPCIQHAYLHKTMMQGGGLEVEIIQEPDPRYVECYDRQRARQKREELSEFYLFHLLHGPH